MVQASDVIRVLRDAARLVREGEMIVFGSAALSAWLPDAPATRDVDVVVVPEAHGAPVEAVMGELSWYDERFNAHVDVCRPDTLAAPVSWAERARRERFEDVPGVAIILLHPHDILFSKIERWEPQDREHARLIRAAYPLTSGDVERLAADMPHRNGTIRDARRSSDFEAHLAMFRAESGL